MRYNIKNLKEKSEKNYEKAWKESGELIEEKGKFFELENKGEKHPLFDLVQELRSKLIDLGFKEMIVPTLIEKDEIRKQYGPEAPIILDRVFFLAGLDRSDLGISKKDLEKIKEEIPEFGKTNELEGIFRRYKQGEISSDDLTEVLVEELDLEESEASHILSLFEDFKKLKPIPSNMTLRSHTTAGWFQILEEMQNREPLPLQLFTVGPKYRREQKLDKTHLYRSWTGSIVIMSEKMSLEDGKRIARKIMKKFGFDKVECKIKSATSKYYAPGSEFEIFVRHPKTGEMIEIGNAGFYSPVSLANYDIPYPVFNLGVGLERVLMIRTGEEDIRRIVYPYRYEKIEFSDKQISEMLEFDKKPETKEGKKLAEKIEGVAYKFKDKPSPCEFKVFEGNLKGKDISVFVKEPEENTKLIGPAAFNEIYVFDGNIVGVPPEGLKKDEFLQKVRKGGIKTDLTYMKAVANMASREIEKAVESRKGEIEVRVPIVESLGDINLKLEKPARRYITNNNKKIDIRGPVFTTISSSQVVNQSNSENQSFYFLCLREK